MRSFGELEARVMAVVWASATPVSVREILTELETVRPTAYTTVITVVERLRSKGWLARERSGRAFVYVATKAEPEYVAHLMSQALDDSDDRSAALLSFAEQLDPGEARALRRALHDGAENSP